MSTDLTRHINANTFPSVPTSWHRGLPAEGSVRMSTGSASPAFTPCTTACATSIAALVSRSRLSRLRSGLANKASSAPTHSPRRRASLSSLAEVCTIICLHISISLSAGSHLLLHAYNAWHALDTCVGSALYSQDPG